jgi:hypothetical protein
LRVSRGHLSLVVDERHAQQHEQAPPVLFCSHCGARPGPDTAAWGDSRVCPSCGLGLMLQTSADLAPEQGGAFVVLDSSMCVCAVSDEAERVLATSETDAVNRHVTELLAPADAETQDANNLAVAITWAARGDGEVRQVTVRPTNVFGVRLKARIGSCGPPRAALLVFE